MAVPIERLSQLHQAKGNLEVARLLADAATVARENGVPETYPPEEAPSDLQRFILSSFHAVEAKDLEGTLSFFADGATMEDPHYPNAKMRGKEEIAQGLIGAFGNVKQFKFTPKNYFERADGKAATIEMEAEHTVLGQGKLAPFRQSFVFEINDEGLITRMQAFGPYRPDGLMGIMVRAASLGEKIKEQIGKLR